MRRRVGRQGGREEGRKEGGKGIISARISLLVTDDKYIDVISYLNDPMKL